MLVIASRARRLLPMAAALAAISAPAGASAQPTSECVEAFETSQKLRKRGKLLEATEALITCSQPTCPEVLAKDCTDWYAEVQASVPTVTLSAQDTRGRLLTGARVYVGERLIAARLDGRAIAMDPGLHEFRFEIPGKDPVKIPILLGEGEKNKAVIGEFPSPEEPLPELAPAPAVEAPAFVPSSPKRPPYAAYVVGGLGILAVGGGVALRVIGAGEYDELEADCKPDCTDDDIAPVKFKYTASTIALGVGGAALLGSAVLFIVHGASPRKEWAAVSVAPAPHGDGALGSITGRF